MIVSRIKCYRWTLRSCTLTCSCLRDATIEHFLSTRLSVTEIVSVNNLPSFLQANPAIWDRTPELFLSGQTFRNNVYRFVPLANLDATVLLDFYRCCQISRPCILGAWFIVSLSACLPGLPRVRGRMPQNRSTSNCFRSVRRSPGP